MKIINICLFALLFIAKANSQTLEILDQNTLQPISDAEVFSKSNPSTILLTNATGIVDISSIISNGDIVVKNPLYSERTFSGTELLKLKYKIYLSENGNSLEEVVVSASKFEEKRKDVVQKIQVIRASDLQNMNQTSTADVMSNSGNILVQKSQQGGGSPIIRGFETNKVLMVVDGIRMNNAIYRGGHIQNIITLDNSIMDKVEIVYGPGSVVYGSDALGGVMHFYTKTPLLSEDGPIKVKANAYTRYTSANSGYAEHADISVGGKRVGSLTSFTYSNYGDLRQGSQRNPFYGNFGSRSWYVKSIDGVDTKITNTDTNLQVGSGYSQYDLLQKFLFKQSNKVSHIVNLQYSNSSNLSRYDRLTQFKDGTTDPKYADWYYGPQKRILGSYTLNLSNSNRLYNHARIIIGCQSIEESRIDRKFNKSMENHRIEKLDIFTFNVDFDKKIGKHELRYGLDANHNNVNSTAFVKDIKMDTIGNLDTRYPDGGSKMYSVAAYLTHTLEINEKLILNDGIRFSNVNLEANFISQQFFPFSFSNVTQNNNAFNGNIGLIYMPFSSLRLNAGMSSGFRAPNVDDLSKVFDSGVDAFGNSKIIVPNPNLKPEYTYTYELGISHTIDKRILVSLNSYYTKLINAISVQNGTFNGQDSIEYNGEMSKVKMTTNSDKAYIYGLEGAISGNLNQYLSVLGTINYTYGRIATDTTDIPLDHIAPIFGKISFNVKVKKFRGEFFVNYSGWKKIADYSPSGEDNELYATVHGMPSWYTTNIRLTYNFNKHFSAQAACENIFDQNYRQFASNISAPGRNFIFTLRGNF